MSGVKITVKFFQHPNSFFNYGKYVFSNVPPNLLFLLVLAPSVFGFSIFQQHTTLSKYKSECFGECHFLETIIPRLF